MLLVVGTREVIQRQRRRRPTRAGTQLSAAAIVDTALRLSAEHGVEALSVRRLGLALGCDPSALYRYFRDTDDLMLAMADRLIGIAVADYAPALDWVATLRGMGHRVYGVFQDHPRIAGLASARVTRRENEFRAVEIGLSAFRSGGFAPADAVRLYFAFIDAVLGLATLDATARALPAERHAADAAAWTQAYQRLPAATYPTITGLRAEVAAHSGSSFPDALELLLAALVAHPRRSA
jgi:AcrR family transcriptional regulator